MTILPYKGNPGKLTPDQNRENANAMITHLDMLIGMNLPTTFGMLEALLKASKAEYRAYKTGLNEEHLEAARTNLRTVAQVFQVITELFPATTVAAVPEKEYAVA